MIAHYKQSLRFGPQHAIAANLFHIFPLYDEACHLENTHTHIYNNPYAYA